ncbi:lipoxygenase family protein [Kribbella sp. CA-247076]|uniref:lipoxygenase family protein n=1 Tax=Kribbella sp. CA-247076 TaxID=3239941 RepID=UPI003D92885E
MAGTHAFHHLPLRKLGFDNAPAVPVDLRGMPDTLVRLGVKVKQYEQALQGLGRMYTIRGTTNRAYTFLYGDQPPDAKRARARERLRNFLHHNPLEIHAALAAEKISEQDDAPAGHNLTTVSLEDPRQWSMSWTTLPDVYSLGLPHLDEYAATVDVDQVGKATEAFFPTIANYGRSYNLLLTRKVRTADAGPWRDLFGTAWTADLDAAAEAGLLYVIDLRIYETLETHTVAGAPRFTPGTVTVLVQDAVTKAMTPELIRVAGGDNQPKIFARQSGSTTSSAWLYALQAAKVSVTVYGIWLGHVYQWHLVTAAMLMTMFDTLPPGHPARRLLEPQSSFLIPFDDVLLLQWTAAAPPTSISSSREFLELVDRYADGRGFFDDDPTVQLEHLGVTESDFTTAESWDGFPIVGDLLSIWNATGRYVDTYVDHAYPADHDVRADRQLAQWIAVSADPDGGNIGGLPAMDSKDALKRVLHSLIYRITAHGTSRLYRSANPVLTFVANFPPCLQEPTIPDPAESFDTRALHRFLPNTGTIGEMLHFYFIFWATPPYVPFVPLEGTDAELFFDDETSNDALIELREFVIDFVERHEPGTSQIWQWERNIEL